MHKHEKSKPWKCEDCDYAHSLLAGLKRHKKTKHPDESTMKVCHICGHKAVTNQGNLLKTFDNKTTERIREFQFFALEHNVSRSKHLK